MVQILGVQIVFYDVSDEFTFDCASHGFRENKLFLSLGHIRKTQICYECHKTIFKFLVAMATQYFLDFLRKMLILLLGALGHILHILFLI